jgi:hypothetical protein
MEMSTLDDFFGRSDEADGRNELASHIETLIDKLVSKAKSTRKDEKMFKLNDGNDIDDQETRDGIVARAYRKAGPFVPPPPTNEPVTLTAPPSTPFGDLVYWHQRASKLAPGRDIIVTTARK